MVINGRKKAHKAQKEFGRGFNYEEHGKPPLRAGSFEFLGQEQKHQTTELQSCGDRARLAAILSHSHLDPHSQATHRTGGMA